MGYPEFSTQIANFNQQQIDDIETAVGDVKTAVAEIQQTDLADVNNKIGTSADGSALLTLFGKLARIISDTSGLDAKLDIIAAYVDTVEGMLATINGHVDSVEGTLATINGHVDTLESSAATTISKLDRVTAYLPKGAEFEVASADASWYTVLDYNGAGRLFGVAGYSDSAYIDAIIRVTVDGAQTTINPSIARASKVSSATGAAEAWRWIGTIDFDSSLLVEIQSGVTNNILRGSVDYGIV